MGVRVGKAYQTRGQCISAPKYSTKHSESYNKYDTRGSDNLCVNFGYNKAIGPMFKDLL